MDIEIPMALHELKQFKPVLYGDLPFKDERMFEAVAEIYSAGASLTYGVLSLAGVAELANEPVRELRMLSEVPVILDEDAKVKYAFYSIKTMLDTTEVVPEPAT